MVPEERWPFDLVVEVKEGLAEIRVRADHLETELAELRQDIRRLDARLFQLMLAQIATLATAMGALVATLAG